MVPTTREMPSSFSRRKAASPERWCRSLPPYATRPVPSISLMFEELQRKTALCERSCSAANTRTGSPYVLVSSSASLATVSHKISFLYFTVLREKRNVLEPQRTRELSAQRHTQRHFSSTTLHRAIAQSEGRIESCDLQRSLLSIAAMRMSSPFARCAS